jgi:hypothetical protein
LIGDFVVLQLREEFAESGTIVFHGSKKIKLLEVAENE